MLRITFSHPNLYYNNYTYNNFSSVLIRPLLEFYLPVSQYFPL